MGWLALASLLHRYSRSSETALDQDLKACRENDPVGALLKNLRQLSTALVAQPEDFSGALADKSGLLALYIACMHRGVLDFFTGAKVLLQNHVDRHHILPRGQFSADSRASADNIANIAFIVGDVNKSIGQSGPEVYLKRIEPRVLKSQCIPADASLWSIERADDFWAARRELLADSFNHWCHLPQPRRCPCPPPFISEFHAASRSFAAGDRRRPPSSLYRNYRDLRESRYPRAARHRATVAGGEVMLTQAVESYIAMRRASGFEFRSEGSLLQSFATFSDAVGKNYVCSETAIEWAGSALSVTQRARRLGQVIRFS
jgi:hypothetical protein